MRAMPPDSFARPEKEFVLIRPLVWIKLVKNALGNMSLQSHLKPIAENLWIVEFPLNLMGGLQGRVVTIIRLTSGELIIHSTGPFTRAQVIEIESLGNPAWMTDTMLRHDTFAKDGRAAFPNLPYFAPEGFATQAHVDCRPLLPAPFAWWPEIQVLLIEGMPRVKEHVFLHVPSRTLIVADLVFNFRPSMGWTSFFRTVLMGVKHHPDSARLYPLQIQDRKAYDRSVHELMTWDFDRIIVGHNEVIETGGKEGLKKALANKGMLPI
jgi:hypothetical protein